MSVEQLHFILYVSESNLLAGRGAREVAALLEHARAANKARSLTGVLAFTGRSFAQYIEGPSPRVAALMEAVSADPRHKNLVILRRENLLERKLCGSHMAYAPFSLYLARHVEQLLTGAGAPQKRRIDRLFRLLTGLVEDAHHAHESDGGSPLPSIPHRNGVGEGPVDRHCSSSPSFPEPVHTGR